ncbi:MAG: FKBP-type peptidyl-prolyl cis-trans isomerase [Gammaproteobacteria bacterium]|nr:FKBP-type peptidyl-prolyl cis-trans isomerase [Gammaproteobacteria bacterium]
MKRLLMTLVTVAALPVLAAESGLETDQQKFSYAVGLQIVQSMLRQGVSIDPDAFSLAVGDAAAGRTPRISAAEMEAVLERQQAKATDNLREMARQNLETGRAYLAKNKEDPAVKALESGLQYKVLREGTGPRPKATDTVKVHYTGTLLDGREFDSSHRRKEAAVLPLNSVIKGWQEALQLMPVGSKWQVFVPASLAYGARGAGAAIGPNETLVFDIELLGIE